MDKEKIINALHRINKMNVLIIGDIMLDHYIIGDTNRISPEAPVPIVNVTDDYYKLGGAGNVANIVSKLCHKVYLGGVIGNDSMGVKLTSDIMNSDNIIPIVIIDGRQTTIKTRIISGNQQLVRIDIEDINPISDKLFEDFKKLFISISDNIDLIIISDYAKGFLIPELVKYIIRQAKETNIPVAVDPKPINFAHYKNVDLLTPNLKEAMQGIKMMTGKDQIDNEVLKELNCVYLVVTTGESGMEIFEIDEAPRQIKAVSKNICDVTGAGDMVISIISLCLFAGLDIYESAKIATKCAGVVVSKLGVNSLEMDELIELVREEL